MLAYQAARRAVQVLDRLAENPKLEQNELPKLQQFNYNSSLISCLLDRFSVSNDMRREKRGDNPSNLWKMTYNKTRISVLKKMSAMYFLQMIIFLHLLQNI